MTALPERIAAIEQVFQQMQPQGRALPGDRSALSGVTEPVVTEPGASGRQWRIVGVDGSTSGCDAAADPSYGRSPTDQRAPADQPAPADPCDVLSDSSIPVPLVEFESDGDSIAAGSPDRTPLPVPGDASASGDASAPDEEPASDEGPCDPITAPPSVTPRISGRCWDIDPRLARLIDAWPELPPIIQAAMLGMAEAVRRESGQ